MGNSRSENNLPALEPIDLGRGVHDGVVAADAKVQISLSMVVPGAANYAGTLSVHFTDDAHASITWPGGTIAVERQIFSRPAESSFRPIPGWWWNPDESGTGYSIEVQGDQLFLVGFMYDDSGRPVWYFSAGPMASATTYRGSILQFANGQTMGGTYHPPGTPVSIGILDIEFTANDAAEFTFSEAPGATAEAFAKIAQLKLKVGKTRKDKGKPQFPRVFPLVYGNQFSLTQTLAAGPMTVTRTFVGNAAWKLQGKDVGPNARAYKVDSGAVRITVETTIGVPGGVVCKGSGVRTFDAKTVFKTSEVTVFDLNSISFPKSLTDWSLRFDITDALMPITAICTAPGGGTTTSTTMALENIGFHDFGLIQNRTSNSSTPATGSFFATVNNIVPTERTTGFINFFVTSSSP